MGQPVGGNRELKNFAEIGAAITNASHLGVAQVQCNSTETKWNATANEPTPLNPMSPCPHV